MINPTQRDGSPGKLGTFGGVFTPSVLTILGLILFLRLGYVVGEGGLSRALATLALATAVSVVTSLSLAAIATNRKVHGGGDYYLISRSLGVAYGGAIGLVLFVAQAVSVAFYCVGFGEGVAALVPGASSSLVPAAAAVAAAVLFVVAYLGADLATRFQFVIMVILVTALVSIGVGGVVLWSPERLAAAWSNPRQGVGFWPLFAIFFPAVTGFTQGVSMSGDLKDAARSLPLGTFAAVGLSTVVYAGLMVLVAAALPLDDLAGDYLAMKRIAAWPRLIDAGILAATLSSALASFLGAPRILQALARDQVFRPLRLFAAGAGPASNPRRAVLLTAGIAFVTIALGNLNTIAALVAMFFLASYGLLNYATYVEATAAAPSFRPRFRLFHRRVSLAGTVLCGAIMFAIDPRATVVAVVILAALHQYVSRTAPPARWHDSRRAYRFRRIKQGLRELARVPEDSADWQPHILVFSKSEQRRGRTLEFAAWITGGAGMVTAVRVVEGDSTSIATRGRCMEAEAALAAELAAQEIDAYPLVVGAPDLRTAFATLIQSWGIGPLHANTVLVNWRDTKGEERAAALWFGHLLATAARLDQNVVVLRPDEAAWARLQETDNRDRRIDVWWLEDESSRMALLLAYLMTRDDGWDNASIRVLVPASAAQAEKLVTNVQTRLDEGRIEAEVVAVIDADHAAVVGASGDATLVFLPLKITGMHLSVTLTDDLPGLLRALPVAALVAATQEVSLVEEEPEAEPAETPPEEPTANDGGAAAPKPLLEG